MMKKNKLTKILTKNLKVLKMTLEKRSQLTKKRRITLKTLKNNNLKYALLKKKINLEFTFDKNFPFSGHKLLFKPTQITYKQPETLQNDDFLKKTFNFLAKNEGLKISKGFLSLFLMHFILCYSSVRKFVTLHLARTYRSTLLRFDRSVEHHFARETSTT